jgi:rRNA-processing protein FCF1
MSTVILDTNALIMYGRNVPDRVERAVKQGRTIVLPQSVKQELVDDVLESPTAPDNHRASARTIQALIDEGYLTLRTPNFEQYGHIVDEARRRIANDELPEHAVKADQYIPAIVCELAQTKPVEIATADRKLRTTIQDLAVKEGVSERVAVRDPLDVL